MNVLPKTKQKVGETLYAVLGYQDENGAFRVETHHWEIVLIRRNKREQWEIDANMTTPVYCTAYRKSENTIKKGEWNKKVITSNSDIYTKKWPINADMPYLFTTPLAALVGEVKSQKEWLKDVDPEDVEERAETEGIIKALEKQITKTNNKNQKQEKVT
jgi:hypothetical protein